MAPGNRVIAWKRSSTGWRRKRVKLRPPGTCADQPASVRFNVDDIERTRRHVRRILIRAPRCCDDDSPHATVPPPSPTCRMPWP
ncbi:hypothetical protein EI541_18470 [Xanthomonas citri pv. eucalyptorum]|nr:hypothetical protein EI541_18470 [Xanthomonas axonopodis pv. eucalyptorum]